MAAPFAGKLFKLDCGPGSLGLACSSAGLELAGVPLLRRNGKRFEPRSQEDIRLLVDCAYQTDFDVIPIENGLRGVSCALNNGDIAQAMIAAVLMKLPELDWDGAVRIARMDGTLSKFDPNEPRDRRGRWTTTGVDGGSAPPSVNSVAPRSFFSDAAFYPEKDGISPEEDTQPDTLPPDWLRLKPGQRIDELGDFLEWIANAQPEDAASIKGEIRRLYLRNGLVVESLFLLNALADAIRPGATREDRESILSRLEYLTHIDPIEEGRSRARWIPFLIGPEAELPASEAWGLGWSARGVRIETELAGPPDLPDKFPVIDRFPGGLATSWKSIDLNAATYQSTARLSSRINQYMNDVASFNGRTWRGKIIRRDEITGRSLELVVPRRSITPAQRRAIELASARAAKLGIRFNVREH